MYLSNDYHNETGQSKVVGRTEATHAVTSTDHWCWTACFKN